MARLSKAFGSLLGRLNRVMCDLEERLSATGKAESELRASRAQIEASLKEKEVLLKEIHHRVKNNLQIVSSLLFLQESEIDDPRLYEAFRASQLRIKSMGLVHEFLYRGDNLAKIDFGGYLKTLAESLSQAYPAEADRISIDVDVDSVPMGMGIAMPCGLIVTEILTNSLKYAFPDGREGRIRIRLRAEAGDRVELEIGDDGIGFDEGSVTGKSLGLTLVRELSRQLSGELSMSTADGVIFTLKFANLD